jgi:serine/threonine-protein kinase HipA
LLRDAVGSLGGARPKVNARAQDGSLWIVKLAKIDDQYAIARAEVMALRLAERCGIKASEADVLPSSQRFPSSNASIGPKRRRASLSSPPRPSWA